MDAERQRVSVGIVTTTLTRYVPSLRQRVECERAVGNIALDGYVGATGYKTPRLPGPLLRLSE